MDLFLGYIVPVEHFKFKVFRFDDFKFRYNIFKRFV